MSQVRYPAVYMRGGTSRALVFHRKVLPEKSADWDRIFLAANGSPDPGGRQLDGMGGGISSLSKVVVVGPPSRANADVDYTFGQVAIDKPFVDYSGTCGNMSSAVGPFAVDEGLVKVEGRTATVRIHNTNTGKMLTARFPVEDGRAVIEGNYELPGVAGRGAPIRLEFHDPGGAVTGHLLPSGKVLDSLEISGLGTVSASLVDATNPIVFVEAGTVGLSGVESPDDMEADSATMQRLESIRAAAAVHMGLADSPEMARDRWPAIPKIAIVAPPRAATTLSRAQVDADSVDVTARMISMGRPHRAIALTAAMCLAVAARIEGSVVHRVARRPENSEAYIRIGHPSGVTRLSAIVRKTRRWEVEKIVVNRTARRLMEGAVLVPASRLDRPG